MANTGNVFPGTGVNNAGIGATAWTNPGNIVSDNTTDATCAAAASSQYLEAKNFGFAIPAGSHIAGVTVRIEASESSPSTETLNAQLQDASGALFGSSKTAVISGTSKTVYTYGSTSDLWGATLTAAILNDADFGVRFWYTTAHDMAVDYVTIAVEYVDPVTLAVASASYTITLTTVGVKRGLKIAVDSMAVAITATNITLTYTPANARYWVGGSGNTSDAAHWSALSGGAGGASVPTSALNAIFDAASNPAAYTVTVDATFNCKNLSFAAPGTSGNVTLAGSVALNIYGGLTLYSGLICSGSNELRFNATSGSHTVTFAGTNLGPFAVVFEGVGGTWTLQDALVHSGNLYHLGGTLNTNGQSVTTNYLTSDANTRTLNLGASNLTVLLGMTLVSSSLTFNAGTSTITIQGAYSGLSLEASGQTFNNVILQTSVSGHYNNRINGSNTFANLTFTGGAVKTEVCVITSNQTITGTLTISGNSAINRLLVQTDAKGTQRTFTAAAVVVSNADFQDIVGAGAGSWNLSAITGGAGDCGGNSGITFTAAAIQYWYHGASASYNWSDGTRWFLATNGGGGAGRVPLPQDTARFDANSFAASGKTVVQDMPRIGSVDWTGVTDNPTWESTVSGINGEWYGSVTLSAAMTLTGSNYIYFSGRGASVLISAGKTWPSGWFLIAHTGTLTIGDAFTSSQPLSILSGTFASDVYNVTVPNVSCSASLSHTINMGSGVWDLTGDVARPFDAWTPLTLIPGTATMRISGAFTADRLLVWLGVSLYKLEQANTGAYALQLYGATTIEILHIDNSAQAQKIQFPPGVTQNIGSITRAGTNVITIGSTSAATHTLTKTGGGIIDLDYLDVSYSSATPGTTWYAGTHSTNSGNNSGWIFTAPPVFITVESAAFVITTAIVGVKVDRRIVIGSASFAITMSNVGLGPGRRLMVSDATFAITASAITLRKSYVPIVVDLATVSISPNTIGLRKGTNITVGAASVAVTMSPISFILDTLFVQPEFDSNTRRAVIVEVTPSIFLDDWTLYSGSVYYTPVSDWYNTDLYRKVVGARYNFSDFTERVSLAALSAAASGYFWDGTNLYVKMPLGVPDDYVIQALVTYYFATEGIVVNQTTDDPDTGVYYQPWLMGNLPVLTRQISDILFSQTIVSSGDISLVNGHEAFHTLVPTHIWKNKPARILLGEYVSEVPNRDEFFEVTTMLIEDVTANEEIATLRLIDSKRLLDKELPPTVIRDEDYAQLGEGVDGTRKWLGYGQAVIIPDLVDTSAYGIYALADSAYQDLFAISAVTAVSKADGTRVGLTGSDYAADLVECTVEITNATYTYSDYFIECSVTGKSDGSGSYLKTVAQIVQDILETHLRIPTSLIDTASFTQADIDAPEELSVWLKEPRSIASIFSSAEDKPSLERSTLSYIRVTIEGLWNIKIWSGAAQDSTIELVKSDFVSFLPDPKIESIASISNVYYDYNHSQKSWSVESDENLRAQYLYETFDEVKFFTFLTSQNDAITLAQRILLLASARSTEVEFELRGSSLARVMAGDYVNVTYSPAPVLGGAFDAQSLEVSRLDLSLSPTLKITGRLGDLRSIADRVGHVTDNSADDWDTSDSIERTKQGFVSDDDGFIDPLDSMTLNKSIVW